MTRISPRCHFYHFTPISCHFCLNCDETPNSSSGVLSVRERCGAGGAENSPKSPKGRAFRTSKRRVLLNAPEKIDSQGQPIHCSGFAHAVKSFNMVDAFGLLSCSAVRDFVTEDGPFACRELQYRRSASFDSRSWRGSSCFLRFVAG